MEDILYQQRVDTKDALLVHILVFITCINESGNEQMQVTHLI
jgi:hypothetical protein